MSKFMDARHTDLSGIIKFPKGGERYHQEFTFIEWMQGDLRAQRK